MSENAITTYFGAVPFDVLENIADQLLFDRSGETNCIGHEDLPGYEKSISFCKESETSRQAVLSILKHKLILSGCQSFPAFWIKDLFGDNLRHLDLKYYPAHYFPREFPAMPNLRTALIHDSEVQIQAISQCRELETLEILAFEPDPFKEVQLLIKTLDHLPTLKKLSLSFYYIAKGSPLRNRLWQKKLAEACPNVENFIISNEFDRVTNYWTLLTSFKSLKKLTIDGITDERMVAEWRVPFFRSLDGVYFSMGVPIRWALSIGAVVKGLSQYRGACDSSIRYLAKMPQLTQLYLKLIPGTDGALLSIPLHHIEQLSLDWRSSNIPETRQGEDPLERAYLESWYQSRDGEGADHLVYEPSEEVLLDICGKFRNLTSLSFYGCRIKSSTVKEILQIVGPGLEQFDVAIDSENEPAVTQMTTILHAIADHCPNIREIWFVRRGGYSPTLAAKQECLNAWDRVARNCRNVICSGPMVKGLILPNDEG